MSSIVRPERWDLVNRESLLQQLADALKEHELASRKLSGLKVTMYQGEVPLVCIFSVQVALDYLVNDIYWDAEDNWRAADRLTVETY